MATGSGKTFTAISSVCRLIKFAGVRRVLLLVDCRNLARQTKKEFDACASPYNNFEFGEEYIVRHLTSDPLDTTARVTICIIQRLFSMLKGSELQILYNRQQRLKSTACEPLIFEALKTLADALQAPPLLWTDSQL